MKPSNRGGGGGGGGLFCFFLIWRKCLGGGDYFLSC